MIDKDIAKGIVNRRKLEDTLVPKKSFSLRLREIANARLLVEEIAGRKFRSLGRLFSTKPQRPEDNVAPPHRIAVLMACSHTEGKDMPLLQEDAFKLMKQGYLSREASIKVGQVNQWYFKLQWEDGLFLPHDVADALTRAIQARIRL